MTILVTGSSGLLGQALAQALPTTPLPRGPHGPLSWQPGIGVVDDGRPIDAVVHLAGKNVSDGRWTARVRKDIRDSRVEGTRTLVDWLGRRAEKPRVLICASAVGIYGDRGDEPLHENTAAGKGFLAGVVEAWEAEARRAAEFGVRTVLLRFGVVLDRSGGALHKMLPAFQVGAGGPLGSGTQWFPWVHRQDAVGAVAWAIDTASAEGAYNVVAPGILRQRDFAKTLGKVLQRPAVLPAPAAALRLAFGAMADEALLASQRVEPRRLEEAGFTFAWPTLEPALRNLFRTP